MLAASMDFDAWFGENKYFVLYRHTPLLFLSNNDSSVSQYDERYELTRSTFELKKGQIRFLSSISLFLMSRLVISEEIFLRNVSLINLNLNTGSMSANIQAKGKRISLHCVLITSCFMSHSDPNHNMRWRSKMICVLFQMKAHGVSPHIGDVWAGCPDIICLKITVLEWEELNGSAKDLPSSWLISLLTEKIIKNLIDCVSLAATRWHIPRSYNMTLWISHMTNNEDSPKE